jgi:AcrR family transcriptional regulator
MTGIHSTQPRGPYAKTAARRAAIIEAAREGFVENGYAETSMRDIAKRAGMTHAGLLHHFDSKADLLLEVLREHDDLVERRISELIDAGYSHARRTAQILHEGFREPELVRLWAVLLSAAARAEHPAHDHFVGRYERYRSMLAGELAAVDSGLALGVDAERAATLLIAALDGLALQSLLDPQLDMAACVAELYRLLTPGAADVADGSAPKARLTEVTPD